MDYGVLLSSDCHSIFLEYVAMDKGAQLVYDYWHSVLMKCKCGVVHNDADARGAFQLMMKVHFGKDVERMKLFFRDVEAKGYSHFTAYEIEQMMEKHALPAGTVKLDESTYDLLFEQLMRDA